MSEFSATAFWECNKSEIVAVAVGPIERSSSRDEAQQLEVTVQPWVGNQGANERVASYFIRNALSQIVATSLIPKCAVAICVQPKEPTLGLFSGGLNAAMVALLKAGIACRSVVGGLTLGMDADGNLEVLDGQPYDEATADRTRLALAKDFRSGELVGFMPMGNGETPITMKLIKESELVVEKLNEIESKIRKIVMEHLGKTRVTLLTNNGIEVDPEAENTMSDDDDGVILEKVK